MRSGVFSKSLDELTTLKHVAAGEQIVIPGVLLGVKLAKDEFGPFPM